MKKIIIGLFILAVMFSITGCFRNSIQKKEDITIESVPLMEFDKYKDIDLNNVESLDYIRYTEAGRDDEKITDLDRIKGIYNTLSNLKVGKEVSTSCEDNTKVYVFNMKNGNNISVEIECDWLVLGNKRYEIN